MAGKPRRPSGRRMEARGVFDGPGPGPSVSDTGKKNRRVSGNVPRSTVLTQHRLTPTGIWCSALHAIVQAWHPMHLRRSIANP